MTTRKEFSTALNELQGRLKAMGDETEAALHKAVSALVQQDLDAARRIIDFDAELNRMEDEIVEWGIRLIATQQPVAKDLRRIIVALKISSDLERMADLAVDIAKVVVRINKQQLIKPLVDIPRMAEITGVMIHEAIQAYLTENIQLAYKMAQDDDRVDSLYSQILQELFAYMSKHPEDSNQAMLLSFIGRYLERIADHATNIGEQVVYLVEGKRPDLNS
ncbi:phosphate signaling complex protein PhoU [Paenibacillus sp. 1P07SE]|uniref:phosphate signaling complex protein PhoU n=1 Tax=Paenibacillus sp. 1P07SE TaxID=3132209 RepID=UPI0039A45843